MKSLACLLTIVLVLLSTFANRACGAEKTPLVLFGKPHWKTRVPASGSALKVWSACSRF